MAGLDVGPVVLRRRGSPGSVFSGSVPEDRRARLAAAAGSAEAREERTKGKSTSFPLSVQSDDGADRLLRPSYHPVSGRFGCLRLRNPQALSGAEDAPATTSFDRLLRSLASSACGVTRRYRCRRGLRLPPRGHLEDTLTVQHICIHDLFITLMMASTIL